ncbi:hypothetical protein PR048_030750 [Dryococelus australis]|uniref:Uncharacterized protein n=1 Tax=Dryococelus australis TaxID=614101 RepID=A0ABQ9G9T1_9NEOP|nr:hypothetical protein PR048_030750 [Dryococelus australis]
MQGREEREYPEKTRRQSASPTCKNPGMNPPVIEPGTPLLACHQGEPGSIPGRVAGFPQVRIVQDDATSRRVFLRDLPFLPSLHSGAAPYSPQSSSSVLKTSLFYCYVLTASHPARVNEEKDGKSLCNNDGGGKAMTGFKSQTRAEDPVPSDRRRAAGGVTSGREICDCEYQAVKGAAGRLDYWTRCTPESSAYCRVFVGCYHTPGSFGIRKVFPCKSVIGSEACRTGLINCDPIAKTPSAALPALRVGWTHASKVKKRRSDTGDTNTARPAPHRSYAQGVQCFRPDLICTEKRHDGNTARLARRSDEALGVRVSVARIAPSLLDLGRSRHVMWHVMMTQSPRPYFAAARNCQLLLLLLHITPDWIKCPFWLNITPEYLRSDEPLEISDSQRGSLHGLMTSERYFRVRSMEPKDRPVLSYIYIQRSTHSRRVIATDPRATFRSSLALRTSAREKGTEETNSFAMALSLVMSFSDCHSLAFSGIISAKPVQDPLVKFSAGPPVRSPVGAGSSARAYRGGGNERSLRKPADQRHRPARFPNSKIRSDPAGIEPGSPWWEASRPTAQPLEMMMGHQRDDIVDQAGIPGENTPGNDNDYHVSYMRKLCLNPPGIQGPTARLPPWQTGFNPRPGSSRIFASGDRAVGCGFSRVSPSFFSALSFRRCSILTSFQDFVTSCYERGESSIQVYVLPPPGGGGEPEETSHDEHRGRLGATQIAGGAQPSLNKASGVVYLRARSTLKLSLRPGGKMRTNTVRCPSGVIFKTRLSSTCTRRRNILEVELKQGFKKLEVYILGYQCNARTRRTSDEHSTSISLYVHNGQASVQCNLTGRRKRLCYTKRKGPSLPMELEELPCLTTLCFTCRVRSSPLQGLSSCYCESNMRPRLLSPPPTWVNRARFPAGSLLYFRMWESCRTKPLVNGFSREYSGVAPYSTRFTLLGSQDLAFKEPPKPLHSLYVKSRPYISNPLEHEGCVP